MQVSSVYAQGIIQNTVYKMSINAVTPGWCAVLNGGVEQGKGRSAYCFGTGILS